MASVEAATALITAISIGIAAIAVLINNSELVNKNEVSGIGIKMPKITLFFLLIVTTAILIGFLTSFYYLYIAEFPNHKPIVDGKIRICAGIAIHFFFRNIC